MVLEEKIIHVLVGKNKEEFVPLESIQVLEWTHHKNMFLSSQFIEKFYLYHVRQPWLY